jgi:hypothetical protein
VDESLPLQSSGTPLRNCPGWIRRESTCDLPRGPVKKLTTALLLLSFLPSQLFAWGPEGHAIVADLAASRLTPAARKNLKLLLGRNSLASVASWADQVRKERDESYDWHFVDIPKDASAFSQERDCFRPQDKHKDALTDRHNCVVDRIEMFSKILGDENASREQRLEALKWIVHFVGDIHQPLHAIDTARGGNDIKLPVFGSAQCGQYPCNLHWAWDTLLLQHTGYSEHHYVDVLQKLITTEQLEQKAAGSPADWANESHLQARQILDRNATAIDQSYYNAYIPLVNEKLALAGLRLAMLLNDELGSISTKQMKQDLKRAKNLTSRAQPVK